MEKFLAEMERIVPWGKLVGVIEPYYPKPEGAGRRPSRSGCCGYTLCSTGFNLSDAGVEEGAVRLAGVAAVRGDRPGTGGGAGRDNVCKFRHLLEEQGLGTKLFEQVYEYRFGRRAGMRYPTGGESTYRSKTTGSPDNRVTGRSFQPADGRTESPFANNQSKFAAITFTTSPDLRTPQWFNEVDSGYTRTCL